MRPTLSRVLRSGVVWALLVASTSLAINIYETVLNARGGIRIGRTGTPIDDSYAASATVDFATATTTCTESNAITVTGAAVNDPCFVGVPASGGSTNASYTCYVSAADTVKIRHCAAGSADDPASATFTVRVFDP